MAANGISRAASTEIPSLWRAISVMIGAGADNVNVVIPLWICDPIQAPFVILLIYRYIYHRASGFCSVSCSSC